MKKKIFLFICALSLQQGYLFAAEAMIMRSLMDDIKSAMGGQNPQEYLRRRKQELEQKRFQKAIQARRVVISSSENSDAEECETARAQIVQPIPQAPAFIDSTITHESLESAESQTSDNESQAAPAILFKDDNQYASDFSDFESELSSDGEQLNIPRSWMESSLDDPDRLIAHCEQIREENAQDLRKYRLAYEKHIQIALTTLLGAQKAVLSQNQNATWDQLKESTRLLEKISTLREFASEYRFSLTPQQATLLDHAFAQHAKAHKHATRTALEAMESTFVAPEDGIQDHIAKLRVMKTQATRQLDNSYAVEQATQSLAKLIGQVELTHQQDVDMKTAESLLQTAQELLAARRRKQVPINPDVVQSLVKQLLELRTQLKARTEQQAEETQELQEMLQHAFAELHEYAAEHVARQDELLSLGASDDTKDVTNG